MMSSFLHNPGVGDPGFRRFGLFLLLRRPIFARLLFLTEEAPPRGSQKTMPFPLLEAGMLQQELLECKDAVRLWSRH